MAERKSKLKLWTGNEVYTMYKLSSLLAPHAVFIPLTLKENPCSKGTIRAT
jgi:hypothetical protein